MTTAEEPGRVEGSCLCGAVRFAVTLPTQFCGHCHCTLCRRAHGAEYVTWFGVSRGQIELTADRTLTRFASTHHGTRSFCSHCGSTLFCESTRHPERVDVVLANMQGEIDRAPGFHCYFDDRAPWARVDDGLPRLGGESGLEPIDA